MNARAIAMCAAVTAAGCSRGPSLEPVATIGQIMETTVEPVSNAVFDAAVWENGQRVGGPKTPDDWKTVQANALMLAETTNLLLMPGRAKDRLGWVIRTQAMKDAAFEAAKRRSTSRISTRGRAVRVVRTVQGINRSEVCDSFSVCLW